jgi:hypothetical protein
MSTSSVYVTNSKGETTSGGRGEANDKPYPKQGHREKGVKISDDEQVGDPMAAWTEKMKKSNKKIRKQTKNCHPVFVNGHIKKINYFGTTNSNNSQK